MRTPLLTFLLTVRVPRCFSHPCLIELRLLRWWTAVSAPAQILNAYQPAGKIEEFFQALAKFKDLPTREQAINKTYTEEHERLFGAMTVPEDEALMAIQLLRLYQSGGQQSGTIILCVLCD